MAGSSVGLQSAKQAAKSKRLPAGASRERGKSRAAANPTLAQQLKVWKDRGITYVDDPLFRLPQAAQLLISTPPEGTRSKRGQGEQSPAGRTSRGRGWSTSDAPRSGLDSYFETLAKSPLLTPEQEAFWFRKMNYLRYQASQLLDATEPLSPRAADLRSIERLVAHSEQVRNQLIQANLRLVVSVARRFVDQVCNMDELVSEGNLALMRAVEKFDVGRGFKFSTYATRAIRNALALCIHQLSVCHQRYVTGSEQAIDDCEAVEEFGELPQHLKRMHESLPRLLGSLDPTSRQVVSARYGLKRGEQIKTLEEIGTAMGVSRERVRQIQLRAVRKLRSLFEKEAPEFAEMISAT